MIAEITVVCPQCGNRMRSSSEHIGRRGRCPSCRSLVEIQHLGGTASQASLRPDATLPSRRRSRAHTDVSTWTSGAIGLGATVLLYVGLFLPLRGSVGALFMDRGSIPYISTLLTCWGGAVLALKFWAVKRQLGYANDELELIPLEIGLQITPNNVGQFLDHLAGIPEDKRFSILGRRIQGALEHFRSRTSVPEVQQYLGTQADIDASQVDSGYTFLRTLIWAIPILGFIGTVIGIGIAVAGLDKTLGPGADGRNLMGAMQEVTGGLATAFDTTLLALSMAMLLLFPTESLRKTEYGMLDQIASFSNESLLRRMSDEHDRPDPEQLPEIVRDTLDSAFREHQRWLAQWQLQVAKLGQVIGADFELAIQRTLHETSQAASARHQREEELSRMLSRILDEAMQVSSAHVETGQRIAQLFEECRFTAHEIRQSLVPLERRSAGDDAPRWSTAQDDRPIDAASRAGLPDRGAISRGATPAESAETVLEMPGAES